MSPRSSLPPPRQGAVGLLLRRVPALASLRDYGFATARGDVVAGFSVAAVAVPQAMAYALIVGVPPVYGLYTAIVMTTVGALLDSSRQLINGPTNAISIALASAIGAATASPDERVQAAILMALLVGGIQLAISLLRLGDLTRYISHSVIVGFTAGASVLLVLDQTKNVLGLRAAGDAHDHFLVRFWLTLVEGGAVHGATVAVGASAVALALAIRWVKARLRSPLVPEFLIVVVLSAVASSVLGLEAHGVAVVGDIPAHLPTPQLPHLSADRMRELASSALAIALLGLLEAIAMAKAIAAVTRQKLDLNQQCLSEGFANVVGSFFQCFPGSGSLTRSAVNQQAGGQTQWSGVVSAVAVALTMLLFAPYARFIPRAALAALLMLTAAKMVSLRDVRYHVRVSRFDAVIVAVTAVAAVAISIEFCVLIGVFLSFLLAVPRTGQMLLTEFVVTKEGTVHERLPEDELCGHILIFGLEGEMFFGASTSLESHLEVIEGRVEPHTRVVVMRMKRARNPDAVGMAHFEGFLDRLAARGVHVIVCGVRYEMYAVFERCGLAAKLDPKQVFLEQPVRQTSTLMAIRHAVELLDDGCARCPAKQGAAADDQKKELYYAP
ncbi:MAG: STAS domain-containing protein [Deltaproteobacteria bacterium]|nr:STAS domain-containing protein [Deltaproteobacteria bacterium]